MKKEKREDLEGWRGSVPDFEIITPTTALVGQRAQGPGYRAEAFMEPPCDESASPRSIYWWWADSASGAETFAHVRVDIPKSDSLTGRGWTGTS